MNEPSRQDLPGLYIHVPFCLSKCPYCHFYSTTSRDSLPAYIGALLAEMAAYRGTFTGFDTVYLGGGTPSLLSAGQLDAVLSGVRRNFTVTGDAEITVEANPADIDGTYLRDLYALGVNRLNIGVQSFNDPVLRFLERRHTATEALAAVEAARTAGFSNTGIDLIYGVPGQGMDNWLETLKTAVSLRLPHLSCYQLTVEAETPLGARFRCGEFAVPTEERQYDFFMTTSATLEASGYTHYEVSNFSSSPRTMSRHNQKYWNHTPYLGLGPAAHSFSEGKRWWNRSSVNAYIEDCNAGRTPVAASEVLTPEERLFEAIFLGLRTRKGIPADMLTEPGGKDIPPSRKAVLDRLVKEGFLEREDGFLKPTRMGMAVADSLALL